MKTSHARLLEPSATLLCKFHLSYLLALDARGRSIPLRGETLRTHQHVLPIHFKNPSSDWRYEYTSKTQNVPERSMMLPSPSDVSPAATTPC
jgi:hypothetical protein